MNALSTQLIEERLLPHVIFCIRKESLPLLIRQPGWHHSTNLEIHQKQTMALPVRYYKELIIRKQVVYRKFFY